MTFEVKLLITFVATYLLVILIKFGRNRTKHVEEEANCEKEERKKKLDIAAVTDGVPCRLGDNDPRDPSLTPYPVNVIEGLKLMHA